MKMFKKNRYSQLVETVQLCEERLSECDPTTDSVQIAFLREEIDKARIEIYQIEIKQIQED
tara:strand:- start:137 stop:319 length:183 start_codon:yes stop_codon:yes gene_type:complete